MLFVLLKIDFQRERVLFIPLKKRDRGGGGRKRGKTNFLNIVLELILPQCSFSWPK